MTNVEIVKFEPRELFVCDKFLLTDSIFKNFCDFISDENLDNHEPTIKPDVDLTVETPLRSLTTCKQLVLARSCLSDVIYAIHCLGLWCAKKTVKLYLTEFSRLLQNDDPPGDLIAATTTILNCLYGRFEALTSQQCKDDNEILLNGSTAQLQSLLDYIKDFKPQPNVTWPICIIHVRRKVIAKVIALWLNEVASNYDDYSFIKPNYIVGSSRKHRNRMAVDNFDLHHEASIRDFRYGSCNTLVVSTLNERCAETLRCNLVVSLDHPTRFSDFVQAKNNCRHDSSRYVIILNDLLDCNIEQRILDFMNLERLMNHPSKREVLEPSEMEYMKSIEDEFPPYPAKNSKTPANIYRSINIINKYCSKLPSDSFTRLTAEWDIKEIAKNQDSDLRYYCEVRLPINSPVRQTILGPQAGTKNIAVRLAAFTACKVLHKAGELDDNMVPIRKESVKSLNPLVGPRDPNRQKGPKCKNSSVGSSKLRQYYKKRIAKVFSGPLVTDNVDCYLYKFKMLLTCPIPDEQNRRGRRIIDPSETNQNYAIVCTTRLPKICSFPVFTRSGEVMISVELVDENFRLTADKVEYLRTFHEYTFSKVLRLEKYPTIFDPDNSPFTVLLAPVIDLHDGTEIDWKFVNKIVDGEQESFEPSCQDRKNFKFNHDDYVDAVVIPWYRLTDRQQFAYYVAEICSHMSPKSPFPDENSGFDTFVDYYFIKYNINIYNKDQPVLDVDHTSARLNLLTPRYVNRKGRTLPSSTAKTRKESRESLVQKQLLIPELCTIHPFPASFWRKAVCLPCIFYRLNSLFLAEELRREVAAAIKVGFVEPPADFEWPPLGFGWVLKEVIKNQLTDDVDLDSLQITEEPSEASEQQKATKKASKNKPAKGTSRSAHVSNSAPKSAQPAAQPMGEPDFVIDTFDPSKLDIPDIPLDAPSDWMNIQIISTSNNLGADDLKSGWDQPIEQRDLFIQDTNELTWSDCEMEYEGGDISERPVPMRCGSPSSFEPNIKFSDRLSFTTNTTRPNQQPGEASKMVEFGAVVQSDDSEEDEDDLDEDSTSGKQNQPRLEPKMGGSDSDSSWSLTDDDNNDADDEDNNNKSNFYGEWKDDKSKNQPLLRELFVPYVKADISAETEVLLRNANELSESKQVKTLAKLPVSVVKRSTEQRLMDFLRKIFGEEGNLELSEEEILASLNESYEMLRRLDSRVEKTLINNPDVLKEDSIELVAVEDSLGDYNLEMQPTFGELLPNRDVDCNWTSEKWKDIKFDPTRKEIKSTGPGPSIILQALTMSNASDGINLERLETVGDSFLKYSITAYLYCMCPTMHEGRLSYLRSTEISNANLYKLGKAKNLGELMSATKFEPNDNWLAPGYTVADGNTPAASGGGGGGGGGSGTSVTNGDSNKKREIDKALAEVPYDLLRQHSIPDKSIADCVEALIGAYLTASGSRAALLFMQWLGLRVIPPTYDLAKDLEDVGGARDDEIWRWLGTPASPLIASAPSYDDKASSELRHPSSEELKQAALDELNQLYRENNMDKFEQDIQYVFKDKAYLVQAFTHNSYNKNHVTDCHQRLEFLGDALLDYLITRYLFEDPRGHSPGTLTDLRSALVNNTFFASLAVKYEFHKYLMFISDELYNVIEGFVKKFRFDTKDTITKGYTLLINEGESEYAEDIEVPKALGDVFESVAGAIYLDSGMSLDQVWQVYFKMMKPEIEYFSCHVPKSPIRELLESMPQNVRFNPSELAPDRKHRVTAEVFGLGRFTGVGRNKHSAKSTAAKRALRMLALKTSKEKLEEADDVDVEAPDDDDDDDQIGVSS